MVRGRLFRACLMMLKGVGTRVTVQARRIIASLAHRIYQRGVLTMRAKTPALTALAVIGSLALGAAALPLSGAAAAPARGSAACRQWNISGTWRGTQSNALNPSFRFVQSGSKLKGTATNPPAEAAELGFSTGRITGTLKGSHLDFTVPWMGSTADGHYYGTVSQGHVVGFSKDLSVPDQTPVVFSAHGPTRCVKR